jgi:integrase
MCRRGRLAHGYHWKVVDRKTFYHLGRLQEWADRKACEAAGVAYRRPYTLRHTYASRALSRGVEVAWLAEQMGDNVLTVMRHYARWIGGERDQRELAKLDTSW